MEKSDLTPIVTQLCDLQRQQFLFSQELLLSLAAIDEVMKDRGDKDFQSDRKKKIHQLRQGALGKQIAQDTAIFEQALGRIRSRVL